MILGSVNPKILIIGGAAIFSVLVVFIIIFIVLYQRRHYRFLREKQQLKDSFQQEILKTQLETQEETFYQIGEEIHDNIGQLLSSTKMLLGTAERSLTYVPEPLKTAQETLAKAIGELRGLSKSLNREWLHQFNLIENLENEIARANSAHIVQVQMHSNVKSLPLAPEAQVMLFRIIQEAVNNCIRHAKAAHIGINIDTTSLISVTVVDDGIGFEVARPGKRGVGILNMQHRTSLLKGSISWKARQNGGTEINIVLPIQ